MSAGQLLKQLRKKKGYTQEAVADMLGISTTSYVRYEMGLRQPKTKIALQLCNLFGITLDELVTGTTNVPEKDDEKNDEKLEEKHAPTDEELRFALFGGKDSTQEDWDDVKRYAEFVIARRKGQAR